MDKYKIAIRGSYRDGANIIKALEALGGRNIKDLRGTSSGTYYVIDLYNDRIRTNEYPSQSGIEKYESLQEYIHKNHWNVKTNELLYPIFN